jgi:hypothetical protein
MTAAKACYLGLADDGLIMKGETQEFSLQPASTPPPASTCGSLPATS